MANPTLSSTLDEIVNSEVIADGVLQYSIDKSVIAPLCRVLDISGRASATGSFPQWEKDTGSDITTEGTTTLSNVALQTTEVSAISVAQVGILREVSEMAWRTNMLGSDGLQNFIMEDGAALLQEMLEDDLAAVFSGFSDSVGASGTDLSIANFVQAMAQLDTNNARGRKVCVLDDQQAFDLRAAVAASTGTVFANSSQNLQSVLNARSDAFVGELFGVPIWLTNLTDTANTNADVVGAMFVDGATDPLYAAIGIVSLWDLQMHQTQVPGSVSDLISLSKAYGVGRISSYGVKIVTDA